MKYDYQNYSDIRFETWRQRAACNSPYIDPDLFFPETALDSRHEKAIKVCHTCPVQLECSRHADKNPYTAGVWGGNLYIRGKRVTRN
jgi:WhiB family redox-sensing transcriptional regulator